MFICLYVFVFIYLYVFIVIYLFACTDVCVFLGAKRVLRPRKYNSRNIFRARASQRRDETMIDALEYRDDRYDPRAASQ